MGTIFLIIINNDPTTSNYKPQKSKDHLATNMVFYEPEKGGGSLMQHKACLCTLG
mgnify:FL=1